MRNIRPQERIIPDVRCRQSLCINSRGACRLQAFVVPWVVLWLEFVLIGYGFTRWELNSAYASTVVEATIRASGLEGNLLNDPINQRAMVYLPPSYRTHLSRHYPVVYLLHAFAASVKKTWIEGVDVQKTMDRALVEGLTQEMILVMPNASNAYQGSFYVNSETTGQWEDYIRNDLVSYVDRHFRTLSQPSSRGIAGHSMGGFGAIRMGMKHADTFSAVYPISACCLAMVADLGIDSPGWRRTLKLESREALENLLKQGDLESFYSAAQIALAAAFSPNPKRPPFFADFPWRMENGQLLRNEPAFTKWQNHFPINMVERYRKNLTKLRGLQIEYGVNDQFSHIRVATPLFSQMLTKHHVQHILRAHDGDHGNQVAENMRRLVLPFFSQTLQFEAQR